MKTALILGISGTFGSHMAEALTRHGWKIRAMTRQSHHGKHNVENIDFVIGDAGNIHDVRNAAEGASLIVYAISPANYDWDNKAIPWLNNAATVAEEKRLAIVFPGNVYVFNPEDGPDFDEDSPQRPITGKGAARLDMEKRLLLASERGAQVLIVRAGDFIARDAKSAWLQFLLKPTRSGYTLSIPGDGKLKHAWAYVPDLTEATAQLISRAGTLPAFNTFHFKGYQVSFEDIKQEIENLTGKTVRINNLPWWFFKLAAPFSKLFNGLLEMRYLWKVEANMTGQKMHYVLGGNLPNTSLGEALVQTGLIASENNRQLHAKLLNQFR